MSCRKLPLLAVVAALVAIGSAGCQPRIVLRSAPPTRISVTLRTNPFTGDCVSVTQPQVAQVFRGDPIIWEVVNIDCRNVQTSVVQLRFVRSVIDFDSFDGTCEGSTPEQKRTNYAAARRDDSKARVCPVDAGKPTPRFKFRATGRAAFDEGRHKYDVLVDGKPVDQTGEDPEVCGRYHCY